MTDQKHALVIRVDSFNLGVDSPQVVIFGSEAAAEDFAVDILLKAGLYERQKDETYRDADPLGQSYQTKADVIADFDLQHLQNCETFLVMPATKASPDIDKLLDALEFAEGALLDAFNSEDGLDGQDARQLALLCSELLVKHDRVSAYVEAGKARVV